MKKKLQIGVFGSMADTELSQKSITIAEYLGKEIARHEGVLIYGFEGDFESLSVVSARSSEKIGGQTVAFLWGTKGMDLKDLRSIKIETGLQRGGGREYPMVISCDVIICIGGGSGTLTEIAIAYQAKIPVIVLQGTGGWSDKLADTYLDDRKRFKIIGVNSPQEAVKVAYQLVK